MSTLPLLELLDEDEGGLFVSVGLGAGGAGGAEWRSLVCDTGLWPTLEIDTMFGSFS
jgi:hypothetical protein